MFSSSDLDKTEGVTTCSKNSETLAQEITPFLSLCSDNWVYELRENEQYAG
jgi:hypothetical protein